MFSTSYYRNWMSRFALLAVVLVALGGCGLVALPFRATGAVVKVVPVAGGIVAAPFDATADVID
jgi:hypothetical protein